MRSPHTHTHTHTHTSHTLTHPHTHRCTETHLSASPSPHSVTATITLTPLLPPPSTDYTSSSYHSDLAGSNTRWSPSPHLKWCPGKASAATERAHGIPLMKIVTDTAILNYLSWDFNAANCEATVWEVVEGRVQVGTPQRGGAWEHSVGNQHPLKTITRIMDPLMHPADQATITLILTLQQTLIMMQRLTYLRLHYYWTTFKLQDHQINNLTLVCIEETLVLGGR